MREIKVVHCADAHIGSELSTLGYKSRKRKAEVKKTFLDILLFCKEKAVDFLLIAGDMLDNSNVDENMIEEIKESFRQIYPTQVLIAPGNHDYIHGDSYYMKEKFWTDNVTIWKENLEYKEFSNLGVRIYGAAFTSSYVKKSLLKGIRIPKDDWINMGLFHGEVVSEGGKSNYNPITVKQIEGSRLDYLALGHIHKRSEIQKAGDTYYAYPGCPEGQGFDELDEKGIYFGTIAKGKCNLEFIPMAQRKYLEIRIDISNISYTKRAEQVILDTIKSDDEKNYENHLYKIILEGMVTEDGIIQPEDLKTKLEQEVFYVKIKDKTQVWFDMEALSKEGALKGIFIRRMLERLNDCKSENEKQICQNALNIGLKAFYGEVMYRED